MKNNILISFTIAFTPVFLYPGVIEGFLLPVTAGIMIANQKLYYDQSQANRSIYYDLVKKIMIDSNIEQAQKNKLLVDFNKKDASSGRLNQVMNQEYKLGQKIVTCSTLGYLGTQLMRYKTTILSPARANLLIGSSKASFVTGLLLLFPKMQQTLSKKYFPKLKN